MLAKTLYNNVLQQMETNNEKSSMFAILALLSTAAGALSVVFFLQI